MSDDFSFMYSKHFREHMERLGRQASNTPQMRRATEIALEAARTAGYQSAASAYFRANSPEVSRGILSALSKTNSSPTRAIVENLVEHLRMNPPVTKFAAIPTSTLPALSRMVANHTAVGSQFNADAIQVLFEQVRRARLGNDEDNPPELAGVVFEEFKAIPESDRQTLTPQQARLIKEVIRYLVISAFICLYLTAQEGTELWSFAADALAAYGVFDGRVGKLVDGMVDWAHMPEGNEGSSTDED